jgi:SWI/SNF-related matrix-associated actin-dependent regulator of chromatin subfamily A-like protein 1
VSPSSFQASLEHGEAVLQFPFDERLRQLLRALPGRRWDPAERAWCVPLDPERAEAVSRLLGGLAVEPEISEPLARALERQRRRRRHDECLLELARPDENWWLSFATDTTSELPELLLEHPGAYRLPAIARGLIPLDRHAAQLVEELPTGPTRLRMSDDAAHALTEIKNGASAGGAAIGDGTGSPTADGTANGTAHGAANGRAQATGWATNEVELRRDRRGEQWIVIDAVHAPLARVLAGREGLRALDGPDATFALAAVEYDAEAIKELIDELEVARIDPRVQSWIARATTWTGTIEVEGSQEQPVFLLLGNVNRLPKELREQAVSAPGGATVAMTLETWRLMEGRLRGWISPGAKRCIAALREGRPAPPAVLEVSALHEDPTFVLAPGHDPAQLDAFAALAGAAPGRSGNGGRGYAPGTPGEHAAMPAIRADPFCVPELDEFLAGHETWIAPDALTLLQEVREEHAQAAGLVELSAATEAPLDDLVAPTLGGELKPFQRAGVRYLLRQRRAFLADEQGLGKTIEALATLEADGAYPAIVVCPASLKLNWLRELSLWLPHRSAQALSGTRGGPAVAQADVTVVNYDIVAARLSTLSAIAPRALVLDESHYCKNAAAKRTQAVQQLSTAVPREGLVLALTGTPVMNRPPELISQLRILGRLADFGSGAQFGKRFRGADAHLRLHWHLRARCFARRLKADVLPQLPAKTRAVVPIELDNEPEYRLAEKDLIAWLQSQPYDLHELDARVAAALRAERLVRLNALKLLAARGKLNAALAWIHDFLSSGERLVVFAHHREIQRALLERFPGALHILGADSPVARDAALRAFQEPDTTAGPTTASRDRGIKAVAQGEKATGHAASNQLIICSIEVAGHGITLTQASNVAFLELDWTPAKHDQAEDRCHRIGQEDTVNASYLLAAGTVDETIATLLERKRAVIGAVTDGLEENEEGVVDALVRELRGEPYRRLRAVA